ncbi:endosome-associated-trafficking regulator 1 isoform X2 [Amia ocellicauda]|uniref:endosome-associated-trafficking regulator 1 isoform X2 n=1 Tax=Amia ocellicauda TaxID=2972642 RepID=UPI003464ADFE
MSKHTGSAKSLVIEDDDPEEDTDELNPFSFKEFIRSKNQCSDLKQDTEDKKSYPSRKKNFGNAFVVEEGYASPKGYDLSLDIQGPFFPDPSLLSQALEDDQDDEEDWSGSYQPSVIEEAHEFGLCSTLDNTASYAPLSSACVEQSKADDSFASWELDSTYLEETKHSRKSVGNYEEEASAEDISYRSPQQNCEKLKDENMQLRKQINDLQKKSTSESQRVIHLMDELHKRTIKEEKEAQALESMVQSVEQNLQLMTSQLEVYRSENERLRAGETATLNTMKQNAHMASEYLGKAANNVETSMKQLMSGVETLCLVSQLVKSLDKISEMQSEDG